MGSGLMAGDVWSTTKFTITRSVYALYLYAAFAIAAPTITFPINSQVPPVARVSMMFTFTFSASTFSGSSSLNYTLSKAPSWLSLDGSTRTLSGVPPESAANTAPVIQITASDNTGAATMNTTLVVSRDPAPVVVMPLEDQLAALGTYSPPSSMLFYASTSFNITFDPGTFGQSALNHYAVTLDNAPLPSWITFSGASLSFFGKTPDSSSLIQPPQTWALQLIASDVLGFAGTAIDFNIVVGNHKLDFQEGFLIVNASVGTFLNFTSLTGSLYLDGTIANTSDIVSANAETPDWMKFSNSTFSLDGIPPVDTTSFNVLVTVGDIYGDIASAIVHVHINGSLFMESAGSFNATIGLPFSYSVGSIFSNASDVAVSLQIDPLTPWLSFNNQTLNLSGIVPSNVQPSKIRITVEANSKSSNASGSQTLTLIVVSASNLISLSTTTTSLSAMATYTPRVSTTNTIPAGTSVSKGLSRVEIAAVAVPVVLLFVGALILIFCCYKRRKKGSLDKPEIPKPIPTLSQMEEELEAQGRVTNSEVYATTTFSSKRHTAALQRHSQAMSTLVGGVSMNLRDSRSSGTRGRSYSENALSDFGSTWRYTQDSAYPPLRISAARRSSVRNTRNFSRKTSAPLSLTHRSSAEFLGSTISKRTSKASRSSIQQTPDFAYDSENMKKQIHSRRCTPDYLSIPNIDQRISGIGHGSRKTASSYSAIGTNRRSDGIGFGISSQNFGSQDHAIPKEGNSWVTIGSADLKEQHRRSLMSVLTESTEVLNSPKKMTLRQVPKSPSQPPTARLSISSRFSQPGSKRAVGSSPFFGGSSRAESRGTSRKSLWSVRDRHLYPSSPPGRARETVIDDLEKSIIAGLRDVQPSSSDPSLNVPRDSLGITYGSPREGTRQLRDYVHQLGRRVSLSFRNSLQFSDSDSRFRFAEPSPQSQHYKESQDQEDDLVYDYDSYGYNPQGDGSPVSFNRDRYGLDESPELSQAVGARAVVRPNLPSPFVETSSPERHTSPNKPVQERYMPSPSRPASSYNHGMVREKASTANYFGGALDDDVDTSLDGVHGAFL